jgi:hypothetical protein
MEAVLLIVVLIASVVVHEVAHAWQARREGDDTADRLGRITLNPLPRKRRTQTFVGTCGTGNDSPSGAKAQSVTRAWICGWKWTNSPKVWMAATIPGTASPRSSVA